MAALPSENGFSVGLSTVLEADVKQIVNMARETYEKYLPFSLYLFVYLKLKLESFAYLHRIYEV